MKGVKYLLVVFASALFLVGCVTTERAFGDDYYDTENTRRIGNRVYVDDPYRGTVVLERDPFTGRYYDVTNGHYGYRGYRAPYNGFRRHPGYYSPRVYRNNNVGGTVIKPSPSQKELQKSREEARKKILGN